jgi:hypothetical protein
MDKKRPPAGLEHQARGGIVISSHDYASQADNGYSVYSPLRLPVKAKKVEGTSITVKVWSRGSQNIMGTEPSENADFTLHLKGKAVSLSNPAFPNVSRILHFLDIQ